MSLARNLVQMGLSHGAGLALGIVAIVVITRHYGPDRYGEYAIAASLVDMLALVAGMGLPFILTRDLAQQPDRAPQLVSASLVVHAIHLAIGLVLFLVLSRQLGFNLPVAVWMFAASSAQNAQMSLLARFQADEDFTLESRLRAIRQVAMLLLVVLVCLVANSSRVVDVAIVQCLLNLAGLVLVVLAIHRSFGEQFRLTVLRRAFCWRSLVYLYQGGLRMIAISAGVVVYNKIDVVMIGRMLGSREAGLYVVAYRLFEVAAAMTVVVGLRVLYPRFARLMHDEAAFGKLLRDTLWALFGLWLTAGLAFAVCGPWVIELLFGPNYREASGVLYLLGFTVGLNAMGSLMGMVYRIFRWEPAIAGITACGAGLNVLLNWWWIPAWGILGAAWATLVTVALIVVASLSLFHVMSGRNWPAVASPAA